MSMHSESIRESVKDIDYIGIDAISLSINGSYKI